jgi:hypothetical protein
MTEKSILRVPENKMLITFEPEKEVTKNWRKLRNEELNNLYSSPNIIIIRVIKSRRMRWKSHVARMGEMRNTFKILSENLQGKPRHR